LTLIGAQKKSVVVHFVILTSLIALRLRRAIRLQRPVAPTFLPHLQYEDVEYNDVLLHDERIPRTEGAPLFSLHYLDGFIKFLGFESGDISDLHPKYGIRKCASFQTSEWQGRRIFPETVNGNFFTVRSF
jgi:hypothetical protein